MSFRSGFIGFVGLPNVGKSSLINSIVGEKVGIVTPKPQTTRQRVVGVYSDEESQLLCVDTPGLVHSDSGVNGFLKEEVKAVAKNSDALVAVLNVDAKDLESLLEVVEWVKAAVKPWCVVINKADLGQKHRLAILRSRLSDLEIPLISTSATKWKDDLKETLIPILKTLVPESQALYGNDIYTTQNMRDLSSEIVREKCFEFLHQEIPYSMAVQVRKFEENPKKILHISAELILNKDKHRPIVIGRKGYKLKAIGQAARLEIEKIAGQKVFLELHIKVKPNWMKEKKFLKDLGYVVNK